MGGNYEKGLYDQLMDVIAKLDAMETEFPVTRLLMNLDRFPKDMTSTAAQIGI